jgi:naphthalene 1,2-dioxygenase system ferredoxin subunit
MLCHAAGDKELFARGQERIFNGPHRSYLALAEELPRHFKSTFVGKRSVQRRYRFNEKTCVFERKLISSFIIYRHEVNMSNESELSWHRVAALNELEPDEVACVRVNGQSIALYRIGDDVYATDEMCTHGRASLCEGFLDGYMIECPLHQGLFDVRNGKAMSAPVTEDVRSYPVKVDGGDVLVQI